MAGTARDVSGRDLPAMQLTVVWHKLFWPSPDSPTGFASHGGLNRQVEALSELFDATRIVGACVAPGNVPGERALSGRNVTVVALSGLPRPFPLMWLMLPFWLMRNGAAFAREIARADAVYLALPSPVGLVGLLLARVMGKRLVIRPTTNWREPALLWRLERAYFERIAGGQTVVMAAGSGEGPPSRKEAVGWLFSTTVSDAELAAKPVPRRLEPGRARLVSVGRQLEVEATRVLLLALPRLARDFPKLTLDVVGHGAQLPALMRLAHALQVDDRVTFHGAMSHEDVLALLRKGDVFCLPTAENESVRQAVIEALASGLPVVAPPMSFLAGQNCGVLLRENTPEAVAEAVAFCLAEPERYRLMSIEARRVAQGYSLERWRAIVRARLERAWGKLKKVEARLPAEAQS
jgi:glycosyltransferase involved in cell wall biosynthesis